MKASEEIESWKIKQLKKKINFKHFINYWRKVGHKKKRKRVRERMIKKEREKERTTYKLG